MYARVFVSFVAFTWNKMEEQMLARYVPGWVTNERRAADTVVNALVVKTFLFLHAALLKQRYLIQPLLEGNK